MVIVLLFFLYWEGNMAVVKYLIEEVKVKAEPRDTYGRTPLHVGAE